MPLDEDCCTEDVDVSTYSGRIFDNDVGVDEKTSDKEEELII